MNTVLVVDDDDNIRLLIRDEFCDLNYNVITAVNGEEALISFSEEDVDIVVLDLRMPKIDGLDVLGKIRDTSHVPVIVYTANPGDFTVENEYDNVQMLPKSSDITQLTDLVQQTLNV